MQSNSKHAVQVQLKRLPHNPDQSAPAYESAFAAGADLRACGGPFTLEPGEYQLIPTGFAIALPEGFEAQVRPRSGLAFRHGITVLNSPGTIDADYRGEIGVLLINHGKETVQLNHGDRIAQLIVSPVVKVLFEEWDELSATERGQGGFGSTGKG
ncbi:deoxyuridine 5'-triphosphate nucleotidohydrolase [Cyclonatronum proteinivorum]|uniref:Deoxyuridine 5'-triphosphate nucleotidohydrolase n=1 Tax=Cyclonatronum proteinivorum TaxID=1457365 RepID=A0A345UM02_9BACT|nr:dUTP diphosphatase [Cyclonatronum proteinivorum]AXJ01504.1 deoxyuridine 5'-triphosphate nucleotidohydrolase [Cyclonatronum proteinivorum]